MLAQLHEATLTVLDLVEGALDDDFTLADALSGARNHAAEALDIPPAIATLAQAAAAAQIVRSAGHSARDLLDPSTAASLTQISRLDIEDQHRLVKEVLRHYTRTQRKAAPRPRSTRPVPSAIPQPHGPGRSR
ncbi:hypothetical protein [Streptomyces sp. NPDC018352]|uniref:hypothetical protein n=1 Tax=Streptomyces sp. NPDC018352 TaxID=3157194 RepID=UPI0033F12683